jgi:hypothetical protein
VGGFRWRPADGAVIGVVAGAFVFAIVTSLSSPDPSQAQQAEPSPSMHANEDLEPTSTVVDRLAPTSSTTTSTELAEQLVDDTAATQTSPGSSPQDSPVAAPPATSAPAPAPAPSPPTGSATEQLLGALQIAAESPRSGYDRDLFNHWVTGANGCSVRELVLINESSTHAQVDPAGCRVIAGDWVSPYDGVATDRPEDLHIDHVVALAEAWDSGASGWDAARRETFANDLSYPGSLIAVTSSTNLSKSDSDPAHWRPPSEGAWCQYATDWTNTKARWGLTADNAEVAALRDMLGTCPSGQPQPAVR